VKRECLLLRSANEKLAKPLAESDGITRLAFPQHQHAPSGEPKLSQHAGIAFDVPREPREPIVRARSRN